MRVMDDGEVESGAGPATSALLLFPSLFFTLTALYTANAHSLSGFSQTGMTPIGIQPRFSHFSTFCRVMDKIRKRERQRKKNSPHPYPATHEPTEQDRKRRTGDA